MCAKNFNRQGTGNTTDPLMANTDVVPTCSATIIQPTVDSQTISKPTMPCLLQGATPATQEPALNGLSVIKNTFAQQNLPPDITNIIMASWRKRTQNQYKTHVEKWLAISGERKIDHISPQISEALQFLMHLYNQGLSYSTINTARFALPSILNIRGPHHFGSHPLVTCFLKGMYETWKPQPKYKTIWDVATVLKYLKTLWPLEQLSLKDLTIKLLILLLLITGQQEQSIHLLNLDGMIMSLQSCSFELLHHIKTSKPNKSDSSIDICSYQPDNTLCPLPTLKEYLRKTEPLRGTGHCLSMSYSHIKESPGTLFLGGLNPDLNQQGLIPAYLQPIVPGQLRHPKRKRDVPLYVVLASAGWGLAATFYKFYHKPIVQQPTLAETVLQLLLHLL